MSEPIKILSDDAFKESLREVTFEVPSDHTGLFGRRTMYFWPQDGRWIVIYQCIPDASGAPIRTICCGVGETIGAAASDVYDAWLTGESMGNTGYLEKLLNPF